MAAACLLAACTTGHEAALPADPTARLYAKGLDEITDLYIAPIAPRQLALAGAAQLHHLDNALEVFESPTGDNQADLVLRYHGEHIASSPMPIVAGAIDWGRSLAAMTAAARQASPKIAAMPQEAVDKAVFDGITSKLDRFSRYAAPELALNQRAARDGYGGIGVTLDGTDDFRIAEIIPQSPADRAGLRPDDRITAVDGVPTQGRPAEEVVHAIQGAVATPVSIMVARTSAKEPRAFRLERAAVTAPTVALSQDGTIALIRVASFNHTTTQLVGSGLKEAEAKAGGRLDGIVLDLRSNPGGLLDQAVDLADLFIHDGPISAATGRNPGSRQYFAAKGDSIDTHTPMAVLVNGGSASAAEIVAAALQDSGRAVVIGSSSYGKGTVQTVVHLPNKAELTVTWARLLSPSGYFLQAHGVVPTLCTASLGDGDQAVQTALQRAGAATTEAGLATQARASLDEAGWAALRRACPPQPGRPAVDVKVAQRLLADPKLYLAAVHAIHAASRIAPGSQVAASAGASLTEAERALSSDFPIR